MSNFLRTFLIGMLSLVFGKKSRVGGDGGTTGDQISGGLTMGDSGSLSWNSSGSSSVTGAGINMSDGGWLDRLVSALYNRITAEHMTGADREAAELSYNQQAQFFNDYQSPLAQVQQYETAGLNPALMYGRGATPASPISGNASASAPSLDPGQLMALFANLKFRAQEVDAETRLKSAQANLFDKQAENVGYENENWYEKYNYWKRLQDSTIADIDASAFLKKAQKSLAEKNIEVAEADRIIKHYQGLKEKIESEKWTELTDAMLKLRESATELNKATARYNDSSTDLNKQKLTEAQQSWGSRWRIIQEQLRSLELGNEAQDKENEAFWTDKRIEELVALSEIYDNYKTTLKLGPITEEQSDWTRNRPSSHPSLYGEHMR